MREQFERIYRDELWGGGSGEGSLPIHNRGYIRFLQKFLAERRIGSVVDLGCGDWQFSRLIDWRGIHYRGFDIVEAVVSRNRAAFASGNISFDRSSGDFAELPPADLLIAKDVLQHWSGATITEFLPHLSRYRHCLLTNCVAPAGPTDYAEIPDGAFRPLDLRDPPFSLAARQIFHFTNHRPWWRPSAPIRWAKSVLWLENAA